MQCNCTTPFPSVKTHEASTHRGGGEAKKKKMEKEIDSLTLDKSYIPKIKRGKRSQMEWEELLEANSGCTATTEGCRLRKYVHRRRRVST